MADNKEQFKNYRVGEVIGRGRFAIVYKAEKLDVRKTVALKVLNPEFASRPDIRDQFRDQARQQAKLSHPRLVRVEDLREEHGQFFVAMEYMPLGGLNSWITKNGMLSFRQVGLIIADVAEALDYLHGHSLVHGDIKPSNILLMEDPNQKGVLRAKLSDLRLPRTSEISQTISENLIEVTPEYISPGQARGAASTPLSDQYSLGVVAYEMLCGQPPFTNKSQVDLYIDHQKTRPPSLQGLNSQVTPELEQVVLHALEKSPANRYSSCGEFARALRTAIAATEQKRLSDLLNSAERLLEKREFEGARTALKDALLIQPENEKASQLLARLEQQEGLSKNYQQAVDSLQAADAKAHVIRKEAPDYPDDADYLNTFAPPPPPFWKQVTERWRSAGQLAGFLLLFSVMCLLSITAWIDVTADQSIQPTLVAIDRSSTPTFTPTFTPTITPTFTPTFTFTPTRTSTPTRTATITPTPILISGIQTNLDPSELTNWKVCWSGPYNGIESLSVIKNTCKSEWLMLACRPNNTNILSIAAMGSRDAVFHNTGKSNEPYISNGVGWYFSSDYSWGFAASNLTLNRNECDVATSQGQTRLCWHTKDNSVVDGWRCGKTTELNSSNNWKRLIYQFAP